MQGFLDIHWAPWKRTLMTRSIALVPAMVTASIAKGTGILDALDEWLNVQQSVQLPFALLPLLIFNCDARIMGEFKLSSHMTLFYWVISWLIIGVNIFIAIDTMTEKLPSTGLT